MTFIFEKQENVADWLSDSVADLPRDESGIWQVRGTTGSGKSTFLRLVAARVEKNKGLLPLWVHGPSGELDAGAMALVGLATELQRHHLVNGQLDVLRDPRRSFGEKLELVAARLDEHRDRIVLFCDEPASWRGTEYGCFDDTSNRASRDFADWIRNRARCRRVVSGALPGDSLGKNSTTVPRIDAPEPLLRDEAIWGALSPFAGEIADRSQPFLSASTPLLLRLLVGLAACTSTSEVVESLATIGNEEDVLDRLLRAITTDPCHSALKHALVRVAQPRGPILDDLADQLVGQINLQQQSVIKRCLGEIAGESCQLHPLVRQAVLKRAEDEWALEPAVFRELHRVLASYFETGARSDGASIRSQMEAFHHWTLTTNPDQPIKGTAFFREQLHAAGRALSYLARDHASAVAVFQLAIDLDCDDDYAHHYLAFNLDWQAKHADRIEAHYQEAIRLNPTHPWRRSRWITYLATRGRFKETRSAWNDAIDALNLSEFEQRPEVYWSLHRWVARWLLHWADLDFAERVLKSIPEWMREWDTGVIAMQELLAALREAERGHAVFPLNVPYSRWWQGPHLSFNEVWNGKRLVEWRPARVEWTGNDAVEMVVGLPPDQSAAEIQHGIFSFERAEIEGAAEGFTWKDVRPGRFVELAFYGDDGEMRMQMHPNRWKGERLPPLYPDPDRFFKRLLEDVDRETAHAS